MNKIVINACYGGFGLSEFGMKKYLEKTNPNYWFFKQNRLSKWYFKSEPPSDIKQDVVDYLKSITNSQEAINWANNNTISEYKVDRRDPILIEIIEKYGSEKISGRFAKLKVEEINSNRYYIDEYDGFETLIEPDDIEWNYIKDNK